MSSSEFVEWIQHWTMDDTPQQSADEMKSLLDNAMRMTRDA